jgi:hypothetical protein
MYSQLKSSERQNLRPALYYRLLSNKVLSGSQCPWGSTEEETNLLRLPAMEQLFSSCPVSK